jgi:uncharacterized protein YjbI with pentapeptide repeats
MRMTESKRRSLDETWDHLESQGEEMPRDSDGRPFVPPHMPNYEDKEPLGFSFFGRDGQVEDYGNLTLPRTYFGHSTLTRLSFANTDLSGSRMCWNDFLGCDFSEADLSECDMRASTFTGCKFVGAVLRGADLRRSSFKECDFTGADLTGAVGEDEDFYTSSGHTNVYDFLTEEQRAVMVWTPDEGPLPPGG